LGAVDLSIDSDVRDRLAVVRTTSRGVGVWLTMGRLRRRIRLICADYR